MHGQLCWMTWTENLAASRLNQWWIVCVLAVTEWSVSDIATRILICTHRFMTAKNPLPPLRIFVSRKPWQTFPETWGPTEPSLGVTAVGRVSGHPVPPLCFKSVPFHGSAIIPTFDVTRTGLSYNKLYKDGTGLGGNGHSAMTFGRWFSKLHGVTFRMIIIFIRWELKHRSKMDGRHLLLKFGRIYCSIAGTGILRTGQKICEDTAILLSYCYQYVW